MSGHSKSIEASRSFEQRLSAYGCSSVIRLDSGLQSPAQLEYLDLLPKRKNGASPTAVTAVAENQGNALLYVVDEFESEEGSRDALSHIQRSLANRSDPAWIGVLKSGTLEIYPIGFRELNDGGPIHVVKQDDADAPLFFQKLVQGTFEQNRILRGTDYVFKEIFNLLTKTIEEFVPLNRPAILPALDVLSMAGRALFFRFLIDRNIVLESELSEICPSAKELRDAFSTPQAAAETSAWLDDTFNGDFMRLIDEEIPSHEREARQKIYLKVFRVSKEKTSGAIFTHLAAILRGWKKVGIHFQIEFQLDWDEFNFAHIPVGVLSQVYESFSHRAESLKAKKTSVHYTPRTIAALMVDQSFTALKNGAQAKVLDPTCGAGIFLVLAFRRLVRERWLLDKERPNTNIIQQILYQQLQGFDISESALRLAALALYITAIELNASPRPPKNLKFPKNLRGTVLQLFQEQTLLDDFPLGSLEEGKTEDYRSSFDLVIGNPPWTRLQENDQEEDEEREAKTKGKTDKTNAVFTEIGRNVLRKRGFENLAETYENPGKNPDLPFLWKSMEWAKESGTISLVMPARLFGRTSGLGLKAWQCVLDSVKVTGLINGADLRKTPVWDDVDVPFCIFFAKNAVPKENHRFYYSTPLYDRGLNGLGRFRIDYEASQAISVKRVKRYPWVLKTLSLGTWLDVELVGLLSGQVGAATDEHSAEESSKNTPFQSFKAFWEQRDPENIMSGQGYNRSPKAKQSKRTFLGKMLNFVPDKAEFSIQHLQFKTFLKTYGSSTVKSTKLEDLYFPPLVVISQAPGESRETPRAWLSKQEVAFSQSYYGYSCASYADAEVVSSLIYLLAHSSLCSYYVLMTSRRSGFDRQTFNKEEFDALPFPDEKMRKTYAKQIVALARNLEAQGSQVLDAVDRLICNLYNLDEEATQTIADTLFSAMSYRKAGEAALQTTDDKTRNAFVVRLNKEMAPYFDVCNQILQIRETQFQPKAWNQNEPWRFLALTADQAPLEVHKSLLKKAMVIANEYGGSRIIVRLPHGKGLVLGLLNQKRWWTLTRARLCGDFITQNHLDAFGLNE